MTEDEKYMRRCIQLAQNGQKNVCPNPMVGAVLVCQGRVIGEGYHVCCGQGHAEVNAIASVREREKLTQSTLYVSLEPCSHFGRTPPCADLIIKTGIPRVVVGCIDPFAQVAGRGVQKLRAAGIDVCVGVLEAECRALNKRFITFHVHGRPLVTLKWAQSADGFIDRRRMAGDGQLPAIFSTPFTQMLAHKRRAEHQAILVGRTTALLDNPSLTVRAWAGTNPMRLVIDREGTLPTTLRLFDGSVPTLVFCARTDTPLAQCSNVEVVPLDFSYPVLPQLLAELHARTIQTLLVEGGRETLQHFIDLGLWDEAFVEQSASVLGDGVAAPLLPTNTTAADEWHYPSSHLSKYVNSILTPSVTAS